MNSIYISGKNIEKFPVKAGQFMIFRFLDKSRWWQAHPFSLSMIPKDNLIRITPKNSGDFTSTIHKVSPGTKILVDGPLGIFTKAEALKNKVLFVAGGIGITPIRSLIEDFSKDNTDMVLLYSNKTAKEIVFKQELEQFRINIINFLTEEESLPKGSFVKGRIDLEKIQQFVPDAHAREVYICGPEAFMNAIEGVLLQLKVPKTQIHTEKFSLH